MIRFSSCRRHECNADGSCRTRSAMPMARTVSRPGWSVDSAPRVQFRGFDIVNALEDWVLDGLWVAYGRMVRRTSRSTQSFAFGLTQSSGFFRISKASATCPRAMSSSVLMVRHLQKRGQSNMTVKQDKSSGACRPCARKKTRDLPLGHWGPGTEGHFQRGDARLPAE